MLLGLVFILFYVYLILLYSQPLYKKDQYYMIYLFPKLFKIPSITHLFLLLLTLLISFSSSAQQADDYRSVTGTNLMFSQATTWEVYNGTNWVLASAPPPKGGAYDLTISINSSVKKIANAAKPSSKYNEGPFILSGTFKVDGDFTIESGSKDNVELLALQIDNLILNGNLNISIPDKNDDTKLKINSLKEFTVNSGELNYSSENSNSAIYFDIYGDAFINGGTSVNSSTANLNASGFYLRSDANLTPVVPQLVKISSQVSTLARGRFFFQSNTSNQVELVYDGSLPQNTVYGPTTDVSANFRGLQDRTTNINLTIDNTSAEGVTLSRNQTVDGTLRLLEGELKDNTYSLSVTDGSLIERSGGELQNPPSFGNSSVNLLYSNHTSALTMANEVPTTDIIQNFTISNPNGVVADRDFTINGILDLSVDNPNATNGLLELVRDYSGYAQTPYGSTNFEDSTQPFNDLDSYILTMAASASTVGLGDVTGKIRRTGLLGGTTYDFGHKNTRLTFNSVGTSAIPSAVTMLVSRGDYGEHVDNSGTVNINGTTANRNTVKRLYQIRRVGGSSQSRFTVRFAYQDGELNANPEAELITWDHHLPYNGVTPHEHGRTSFNSAENYVELSNHSVFYLAEKDDTTFTKYWMLSEKESEGDYVWIGAVDVTGAGTNWNVLSNWNGGRVPDETADVTIPGPSVAGYKPTINATSGYSQTSSTDVTTGEVRMRTVEIASTGVLNILDAPSIYLFGGPNEGGGGVNFGTISANGTINPGQSTVYLQDDATASTATISGSASFYNLVVSDNANLDVLTDAEIEIGNSFTLNTGASVDATTNANTIRYTGDNQTITSIGGYHTLDLSSTGTTTLASTLDIHGDLLVNQSTGLDLASVNLSFLGNTQNITSGLLSSLSLGTVTVNNTDAVTTTINSLEVSDLNLTNGGLEVASGANLILSNSLNRTNGRLGGSGTIEFAGPISIESGLFLNDIHQGNLKLNVPNTDFGIVDGFGVEGDLNLIEGNVPLGAQSLKIGGNISKTNGIIDASAAVIEFTGAGDQTIASGAFLNHSISHLRNSGSGGPNLSSELNVTDLVEVNSGTLKSNGNLVLKSTATKTAFVGPVGVNGEITGEVMVERYIPPKRAYRFFASPVTTTTSIRQNWQEGGVNTPGLGTHITGAGASANGFDPTGTNNPSLFRFNNISGSYEVVGNTDVNTLESGAAYYLLIRGDRTVDLTNNQAASSETVIRTKGTMQKSNYFASNLADDEGSDFNLIGNPYQSPVDMKKVLSLTQSSNLNTDFYWVWDVEVNERGGFVAVDLRDDTKSVPSVANQYLQAAQSFFIQTDQPDADGSNTKLEFTQDSKDVNQLNTGMYGPLSKSTTKKLKIDLFYANQSIADKNVLDGTVIKFNENFSNSKDLTDASKFFMQDEEIATSVGGDRLSIQSRKNPEVGDKIVLDIRKQQNTNYALRLKVPTFDGMEVKLKDTYTDSEIIIEPETNFVYHYAITNDASAIKDRFEISFQNVTLDLESQISQSDIQLYPNPNKGNFNIVLPSSNITDLSVVVYSSLGQKIYKETELNGQKQLQLNLEGYLSAGIYFVHLEVDSKTIIKKIIVN